MDTTFPVDPNERIVMTPRGKTANSTIIMMERTRLSDEEMAASGAHVGGGDNQGLIVKKKPPEEFHDLPKAALSLEFCVFLVNQQTGKHTQESRTLRFWFRDGVNENDQPRHAQSFFTDLVNPGDFPRDYIGFIKKVMKLMQKIHISLQRVEIELRQIAEMDQAPECPTHPDKILIPIAGFSEALKGSADLSMDESGFEASLSEDKVLEMVESSYPNPISVKDIATQTHASIPAVQEFVDTLLDQGLICPVGPEEAGLYTRVAQDDSDLQVVRQMPTIASTAQPTIAIITANYCEKLAVDSMIENKQTYVRYNTVGESNVYTLGNIGIHRVVCTKLPTVGHTRNAMIAAGNTTTRLLGTFQQVEYVVLCGVAGGVPHYTDSNLHVRLGDIVVSGSFLGEDEELNAPSEVTSAGRQRTNGIYWYVESTRKRRNTDDDGTEVALSLEEQVAGLEVKSWKPPTLELQQLSRKLKNHWESGGQAPWLNYLKQAERNWSQTATDAETEAVAQEKGTRGTSLRPPANTDRLYMSIGQMDMIEVQHPPLPDQKFEGVPRIHMGTIGCGRDVINGGSQLRREFASRHGIRAFDSEFDQVLESIMGNRKDSWVAIRGIADYRDGTRGKDWQTYAALAAAAFMKSLICAMDHQ